MLRSPRGPLLLNAAYFSKAPHVVGLSDAHVGRDRNGSAQPSMHAEMDLMRKWRLLRRKKNLKRGKKSWSHLGRMVSISLTYSKKLQRWELQNAHPCSHCLQDLRECGVEHVLFSDPLFRSTSSRALHRLSVSSPEAKRNARVSTGYRLLGHKAPPRLVLASLQTLIFIRKGEKAFELRKKSSFSASLRAGQEVDFVHGHMTVRCMIKKVRKHAALVSALRKLGVCNVLPALRSCPQNRRLALGETYYRTFYPARGFRKLEWLSFELVVV